jgi:tripartite-type tricarboxylate transporter receptor subunit TctC
MKNMLRILATCLAMASVGVQAADNWPTRTITIVAPGGAGGTSDLFARLLADGLSKELGRSVIVENRSGAGTLIGAHVVAQAKPDGHTLLIGAAALTISPHMYKSPAVDPVRDFQPVRLVARFPNVVVVNGSSSLKSVGELVAQVRANPGRFSYASGGVGISEHLTGELFQAMTGTALVHIPYKSSMESVIAVVAGDALVAFGNVTASMPQIRAGKLRALAVTGASRYPGLPEVPTVAESGVSGFEVSTWFGLLAPAGTPAEIVTALDEATRRFLSSPEGKERLRAMGTEAADVGPRAFAELIRGEYAKWGEVVRKANVRAE